jgi:threonine dehydrogenase-like Zn-dependent dehydrogenase
MRAITIEPGKANSLLLEDIPEPALEEGAVLARTLAVGVCGTDRELIAGEYGTPPRGRTRLVLGHESLAQVIEAPRDSKLGPGDMIVGIVRHPDPVPCMNCAVGEWDMCTNGQYTEHGIKEKNGFARERFRIEPEYAVRVDPALGICGVLLEPTTILAKAWEHIERIGARSVWNPKRCLITGAGPVGLMAALIATQKGLETHVLDKNDAGVKRALVEDLGATYHTCSVGELGFAPDVAVECTGVTALVIDLITTTAANGITCLTGVSSGGRTVAIDVGMLNRSLVLENDVIFGSVNANRRHYESAARVLAQARRPWLERLITRRVPLAEWQGAYERRPDDVKTIIDFTAGNDALAH